MLRIMRQGPGPVIHDITAAGGGEGGRPDQPDYLKVFDLSLPSRGAVILQAGDVPNLLWWEIRPLLAPTTLFFEAMTGAIDEPE